MTPIASTTYPEHTAGPLLTVAEPNSSQHLQKRKAIVMNISDTIQHINGMER